MLEKFREEKQKEIGALRNLLENGLFPPPYAGPRPDFAAALRENKNMAPLGIIAEFKRASPSKGIICESLSVEDAVTQYAEAGANAISILTEQKWFHGHCDFLAQAASCLQRPLPLLRKDFIFDPLQMQATAASPASALLLIVRLTPDAALLGDLRELAESFGLAAVVEIFDDADLALARESGAQIIQANARNLNTLNVDRLECLRLIERSRPKNGELWIQASGVETGAHLREAANAGFDAVLVGTSLMAEGKPGQALRRLLKESGK